MRGLPMSVVTAGSLTERFAPVRRIVDVREENRPILLAWLGPRLPSRSDSDLRPVPCMRDERADRVDRRVALCVAILHPWNSRRHPP